MTAIEKLLSFFGFTVIFKNLHPNYWQWIAYFKFFTKNIEFIKDISSDISSIIPHNLATVIAVPKGFMIIIIPIKNSKMDKISESK